MVRVELHIASQVKFLDGAAEGIGRLGLPYVGGFNSSFITFGLAIALRELPVGQEI